jgi:hypothetical protein
MPISFSGQEEDLRMATSMVVNRLHQEVSISLLLAYTQKFTLFTALTESRLDEKLNSSTTSLPLAGGTDPAEQVGPYYHVLCFLPTAVSADYSVHVFSRITTATPNSC